LIAPIYCMSDKVDKHLKEALDNIREDRKITRELLDDAIKFVAKDEARHQQIGLTLAKYVETLQRSNEQIVKIAALMSKNEKSDGITETEMEDIYSMIKKEED
jgi:CRISPR/Cas system CSM-associated protein Csm2 small subunit